MKIHTSSEASIVPRVCVSASLAIYSLSGRPGFGRGDASKAGENRSGLMGDGAPEPTEEGVEVEEEENL